MQQPPKLSLERLTVIAWPDEVIDQIGHDPRSRYVETYWLGVLGPSATWLLRYLADEMEASPTGFVMDPREVARQIGLTAASRHSPFQRGLGRLVQFELAQAYGADLLAVRRKVPSLSRRHLHRLSPRLQLEHERWQSRQLVSDKIT